MEGDEMEMSKDELQRWIRERVKKNRWISTDVLVTCNLLQSLLERREKQAAHLLKLCESVAACETVVKKQYSLLGWEYRDTDSDDDDDEDDDDDKTGCANTPPSPCKLVNAESQVPSAPKLPDSKNLDGDYGKKSSIHLRREPVVVLTRLSKCMIRSYHSQSPQNHYSEKETSNNSVCDMQWEPRDDSNNPDYSTFSYKTGPNKRRKIDQKNEKPAQSHATPRASINTDAKSNAAKTSKPRANGKSHSKSSAKSNVTKTSTPKAKGNAKAKSKAMNTRTSPANTKVSALCQTSDEATKTPPSVPEGEICVNMNVLARRSSLNWKWGKVMEIVTKEDGRLKYKINFEDKGRSLVSGHHITFDCVAKMEQLVVGARVVVKCQADQPWFCPGVLAEVPSRRNHMRFLVFKDDHTPVYVGLPSLRLVFKPLDDPLDDIPDANYKKFIKDYIKEWPYPPQTQYRVGQIINAELNGVQERCEVQVVDCSLIQVFFKRDQLKEWIYRGSMRLEHMLNMREHLEWKKGHKIRRINLPQSMNHQNPHTNETMNV